MISPRPSPMMTPKGDDLSDFDFTLDSDDSEDDEEDDGMMVATRSRSASTAIAARSKKPGPLSKNDVRHIVSEISNACKTRDLYDPVFLEILPRQSHEKLVAIREMYRKTFPAGASGKGINFTKHIKAAFSGSKDPLAKALWYCSLGRWESEANWANTYYQDSGSKHELVIEALAGRSNYEIVHIKEAFIDSKYNHQLDECIYKEFPSTKFKKAILIILEANRDSEGTEVRLSSVGRDVESIHRIVSSRSTSNTGETELVNMILHKSDKYLRELLRQYTSAHGRRLDDAILARSNNLVGELLAHMLVGIRDRVTRDARLLQAAIKSGNVDLLISRFVRVHWDTEHMEDVKEAYEKMYGQVLAMAVAKDKNIGEKMPALGEFICQMLKYHKSGRS